MNKQMTSAEIETDACGCGRFTGLDKFDSLLGPNEGPRDHSRTGMNDCGPAFDDID